MFTHSYLQKVPNEFVNLISFALAHVETFLWMFWYKQISIWRLLIETTDKKRFIRIRYALSAMFVGRECRDADDDDE